jgi:hypothetical protein
MYPSSGLKSKPNENKHEAVSKKIKCFIGLFFNREDACDKFLEIVR